MDVDLEFVSTRNYLPAIKRGIDFIGAALNLILLFPLMLLIGMFIRVESPGKVIFHQERLGYGGGSFRILKFRTMREDAEEELLEILSSNPEKRAEYESYQKLAQDPRLTRVGRVLRRYSLDELPQLWNVIRGEMSLIGPRPILPEQIQLYGSAYKDYRKMIPGMTGLWQVSGRNNLPFAERARLDQIYIRDWSLWLDLKILVLTPRAILDQRGGY